MKDAESLEVRASGHPRPDRSNSALQNAAPCYKLPCLTVTQLMETRLGSAGGGIHKRLVWTGANWDARRGVKFWTQAVLSDL